MLQFKHPSDISQLSPSDPAHPVTQDLISRLITPLTSPSGHYDNDAYGWIVLIQEGDWNVLSPTSGPTASGPSSTYRGRASCFGTASSRRST